MPRYFFHLRNAERSLPDVEGVLLDGPEAARREAIRTAQDFFQPWAGHVDPDWQDWCLEVLDGTGASVVCLEIAETGAPEKDLVQPERPQRAASSVVYLNLERARRDLSYLGKRTHELVRRHSMLMDHNRYETKKLLWLRLLVQESRQATQETLQRSRQQTSSCEWFLGRARNEPVPLRAAGAAPHR